MRITGRTRGYFRSDEKAFRPFKIARGTQNYLVWIDEASTQAHVPAYDVIRGGCEQQGGVSIMVALAASWKGGLGRPRFVDGSSKINSEKYLEIRRGPYLADIAGHFVGDGYAFQQDGAPAHTSKATQKFSDQNSRVFPASQNFRRSEL